MEPDWTNYKRWILYTQGRRKKYHAQCRHCIKTNIFGPYYSFASVCAAIGAHLRIHKGAI